MDRIFVDDVVVNFQNDKIINMTAIPKLDPTATWWAKRWWQSATDAEKEAMRILVGSE